jgi:4'-phosphopantetheinyl transferase
VVDCTVWWAEPVAVETPLTLLDEVERERHQAYRQDIDKRRFLTGRMLAKTVLGGLLGREPAAVVFDATCEDCGRPHGRPRVPGAVPAFSISHSGDRIGLAVTAGAPVGLDVETAARRSDPTLIDYALNEVERATLAGLPDDERASAFFTFWTRKEALMKATGRGLKIALKDITLSGPGRPAELLASADAALDPATTRLADLAPGDGYRGAVAVLTAEDLTVSERPWTPTS